MKPLAVLAATDHLGDVAGRFGASMIESTLRPADKRFPRAMRRILSNEMLAIALAAASAAASEATDAV